MTPSEIKRYGFGCVVIVFALNVAVFGYLQTRSTDMSQESAESAIEREARRQAMLDRALGRSEDFNAGPLVGDTPAQAAEDGPSKTPERQTLRILPPVKQGTMEEMWGPLKRADDLYLPVFGLHEGLTKSSQQGKSNVNAVDIQPKYLYVRQQQKGKIRTFLAVYSDLRLMKDGAEFTTVTPQDVLHRALYDPEADGLYFNPTSRLCNTTEYAVGINSFGIAEVLGCLQAPPRTDNRPYHELANEAAKREDWFLVQYYWGMSRREGLPGDDWTRAELSKLRSWMHLDFPGARERALGELRWFMGKYGETAEARELLDELQD